MRSSKPPIHGRHVVIIHNSDTGVVTGVAQTWQRLRQPEDPNCALCALTRGVRGRSPRWKKVLDSLPDPVHEVNRDQWRADHASSSWRNIEFPAILLQTGSKIEKLVSAREIRKSTTIKELAGKISEALLAHPEEPQSVTREREA